MSVQSAIHRLGLLAFLVLLEDLRLEADVPQGFAHLCAGRLVSGNSRVVVRAHGSLLEHRLRKCEAFRLRRLSASVEREGRPLIRHPQKRVLLPTTPLFELKLQMRGDTLSPNGEVLAVHEDHPPVATRSKALAVEGHGGGSLRNYAEVAMNEKRRVPASDGGG